MNTKTLILTAATALFALSAASLAQPVRFAHMAQGVPNVDVYLDGQPLTGNAAYSTVTPYQQVASGGHTLKVTQSGQPDKVFYQGTVTLSGDATTLAAWNDGARLRFSAFADTVNRSADSSVPRVRAYNLSPRTPYVNVGEVDGPSVASGLAQGTVSPQSAVSPNLRTFGFSPASDEGTPLHSKRADSTQQWMGEGRDISLFLTSDAYGENQVVVASDAMQ